MSPPRESVFLCNGAEKPSRTARYRMAERLQYRKGQDDPKNVEIGLSAFVDSVLHLPDRWLDLVELAGYLFAADRITTRGDTDVMEYHTWSRSFEIVARVRDVEFWSRKDVQDSLDCALRFMSGDRQFKFSFQPGHATPKQQLFDVSAAMLPPPTKPRVMLFSGGLDSLAGALDTLAKPGEHACLVSHESQTVTMRTQRDLAAQLQDRFPGRVHPFTFRCHLSRKVAPEETQRTRSFVYLSMAAAVATALGEDECHVHENGMTALAFPERGDLLNARASRTTHPKTLRLLEQLLSLVLERPFRIHAPFQWETKADILRKIADSENRDLLNKSVSCSRTRSRTGGADQCGCCSQCVERRLAAYSVGVGKLDSQPGSYGFDFVSTAIEEPATRSLIIDYLRAAKVFAVEGVGAFEQQWINELVDITEGLGGKDDLANVHRVWQLCRRHGQDVLQALREVQKESEDLTRKRVGGSLLDIVASQDYLVPTAQLAMRQLASTFEEVVPVAFASKLPDNEQQLNDLVDSTLRTLKAKFKREFPSIEFATARTVPDHSDLEGDLFIESKYLRPKTAMSKITDEIAADQRKYGRFRHILFVLYDPHRRIRDDARVRVDFSDGGRCRVCIIRR